MRNNNGHTLMELMLAILVTATVSTIVFAAFVGIQKQFIKNQKNANIVFEMINTKTKLNKIFQDVDLIVETYSNKIVYKENGNDDTKTITFRSGALEGSGKTVIKNLESFKYEIIESDQNVGAILSYEIVVKEVGWVGGACWVLVVE